MEKKNVNNILEANDEFHSISGEALDQLPSRRGDKMGVCIAFVIALFLSIIIHSVFV